MTIATQSLPDESQPPESETGGALPEELQVEASQSAEPLAPVKRRRLPNPVVLKALFILSVFVAGMGSGFLMGRQTVSSTGAGDKATESHGPEMIHQINPPEGYEIPVKFGDIGPQMLTAGAIDLNLFMQIYEQSGRPLTDDQMAILTKGSNSKIVISQENAHFLLNFFWAFGLTNQNPVLTEGPMMAEGKAKVGNFASTGGWTIGAKAPEDLYASAPMVMLTEKQQDRLKNVAISVFRPCCNNPTHFPDCNHGMAMLGLLELMAAQDATEDEMYAAAKYVNAFWYPQQTLEIATVFKATQNVDFAKADARQVVSKNYSSGAGFQAVHQWLASNGLLEQAPSSGGGCAVQ